jgi:hypothetical protein
MKVITLLESYVALKHHSNIANRMKKCYHLINSLRHDHATLGEIMSDHVINADKDVQMYDVYMIEARKIARTMKSYRTRINKLTNYYNSLITI